MSRNNERGMTIVEIAAVLAVVAILALSLWPLLRTTYDAWVVADRRTEVIEEGRVAMGKVTQEIRRAYDLYSATDPTYVDFYPSWATTTSYRAEWDSALREFEYGVATPAYASGTLAAPMDSFTYVTYTRKLTTGVTRARRINALYFLFAISDVRRKLPVSQYVNPMQFRSFVQVRNFREGYSFAKSSGFATESYTFRRNVNMQFCVKVYCDRVDPMSVVTNQVTLQGAAIPVALTYTPDGDYFYACCTVGNVSCFTGVNPSSSVAMQVSDPVESCDINDIVRITN